MALGWGSLVVAAGVSYYYARKSINKRRKAQDAAGERSSEKLDWHTSIAMEEKHAGNPTLSTASNGSTATGDTTAKSSSVSTGEAKGAS